MLESFCKVDEDFYNDLKLRPCICTKEGILNDDFEIIYILVVGLDYFYMIEIEKDSCLLIKCDNKVCYIPTRSDEKWE